MKKTILTTLTVILTTAVMAQKKPSADTTYILHTQDVNRIYNLLSAGANGVATSDNYSKNQVAQYNKEFSKIDSAFRPQILKWFPPKAQPVTKATNKNQ